ncbi:ABC transporter permease [Neobacillus jeddahensis]|uniref:ABC transporter permease n=1 Tax=Neobacillus jeddahensis TaxID=1461580 RepID=UPI00058B7755|nr:ABC transporter permease [Neobacillus jeddahensis]
MNTIVANSYNELQKLVTRRVTKLFFGVALSIPFIVKLVVNKLFITDWMALPSENINFSILDLFITIILPLFIFIAATYLFTGESERGTLLIVRPISRIELYLTKTAAISIIIMFQLLMTWLSIIISSVLFDQSFHFSSLLTSLAASLLSWVPLIVLTSLAIVLALLVNSSVLAISSMIFLYLLMFVLPYLFPNVMYLLPSSYLDWYMQWFRNMSIQWLIQTFTYLCSSFALYFCTGYFIFSKKEV